MPQEFLGVMSIMHEYCYWLSMREELAEAAMSVEKFNVLVARIDFDVLFRGRFSDKESIPCYVNDN
eukprot:553326-Amphidinium_carterae.1